MAKAVSKTRCITCNKGNAVFKCGGCQRDFCNKHATDHRQELSKEVDEIEVNRDLFRQTLTQKIDRSETNSLLRQIDKWERDSIKKVRQMAEQARQELLVHIHRYTKQIETDLNRLTDQLRRCREENDFIETDLQRWKHELNHLTNQLEKPANITIQQHSIPLITKITVNTSTESMITSNISANTRWTTKGITVAGGNGPGKGRNQLCHPHNLYVDDEQTIYIVDCENHRIVQWKSDDIDGEVVAGGNGPGNKAKHLNKPTDVIVDRRTGSFIICDKGNRRVVQWPRRRNTIGQRIISDIDCYGLAMDNNGYIYVSNTSRHEVRRWKLGDTSSIVVAGGNGPGYRFDQLNGPTFLFVDVDDSVYVSDTNNHRVMKWMKGATKGIIVAGGQGQGNDLRQLSNPYGIRVDSLGTVYIADYNNNRIICWPKEAEQGSIIIDSNDQRNKLKQLNGPGCLAFDREGNLYVVDNHNHRVQQFNITTNSDMYASEQDDRNSLVF